MTPDVSLQKPAPVRIQLDKLFKLPSVKELGLGLTSLLLLNESPPGEPDLHKESPGLGGLVLLLQFPNDPGVPVLDQLREADGVEDLLAVGGLGDAVNESLGVADVNAGTRSTRE